LSTGEGMPRTPEAPPFCGISLWLSFLMESNPDELRHLG
jgi:hypothetical protein